LLVSAREALLVGQVSMPFQAMIASLLALGLVILALAFLRLARPHLAVRAG
jgi:hypothetical protein